MSHPTPREAVHGVRPDPEGPAPSDNPEPEPLSIGEVLAVLAQEFPDVTVSKIRFLESQGLVTPDRNASGYRQFDDADIERLRWILRQQRDKFLPLKVIKRALDSGVDVVDAGSDQPTLWTAVADDAVDRLAREEAAAAPSHAPAHSNPGPEQDGTVAGSGPIADVADSGSEVAGGSDAAAQLDEEGSRSRHATAADVVAALQEDPRPRAVRGAAGKSDNGKADADGTDTAAKAASAEPSPAAGGAGPEPGVALDRGELLAAAGLDPAVLESLEEFGLVAPEVVGGEPSYDATDLLVCEAAARCGELGLGPRHLRIYKVAAVREAGLVEQLVMPLVKQRNPEARAEAERAVAELTGLGARVHAALLARELGPLAPPGR